MTTGGSDFIISVENLKKSYTEPLFQNCSFQLKKGEGLGVWGRNGSGKTTLLDIIAGIQKPDAGSAEISTTMSYCMQPDGFQDSLSCRDNLLMEAALCGLKGRDARDRVEEVSRLCGVSGFLKKKLSKCSAGMRGKVSIAACLIPRTGLILLDEAFAPLDAQARQHIKELLSGLKKEGAGIIMVSHDMDDFKGLCEKFITIPESSVTEL